MDLGSIIGVVLGLALIGGSILLEGSILTFYNLPSILIVIGGTIAGLFVAYPMNKVKAAFNVAQKAFKGGSINYQESINQIVEIANVARREGLLALEEAASKIDDDFLKKGIMLIVDGTDPELVRNILETELAFIDERHGEGRSIFDALGAFAPAFGMIGTLIGLINMLQSLEDPTSVGPKMSVALITTFYGAVLANLVFIPIATKLKLRSKEEMLIKEVMVEGLLSIQAGENPRIIEVKLESFLPPSMRKGLEDSSEGAEG
ncbi:flagellar motor protein [Anaeromicrobium sediminis]|uniref:Motility protein A n=1 Tax=Anaeromicrobium sediminis TaxID=1478221 RepID=A0A267MNT9_9FIRM|nr:flagellar motor protein [Anaeromicrobium sediminis]PAB61264.1 motility protein A [Anaeromicrobium sediminis]